jgi:predicted ATPase/class 3 adenylate cyclase
MREPVRVAGRPSGTITFLFTDVERSTRLWEERPEYMGPALARHDAIVRAAVEEAGGYVFSTAGDAFSAAFAAPSQAASAARDAQIALASERWPVDVTIRVRMGLHTGTAEERDGNYFGTALNRVARLTSAAHGGQVLVSNACAQLLDRNDLVDLGEHRLKDLTAPERIWQLGRDSHPPITTLEMVRHNLPIQRGELFGRTDAISDVVALATDHALVSLVGIGGAGKTRLALAVAAELSRKLPDGVWFVDLVAVADASGLSEAVAHASGLPLATGTSPEQLAAAIGGREALYVLDNCEHMSAEVAQLVEVLLERTSTRILVTSREPLDLPDEWLYRVPPLAVGPTLDSPAVAVFARAAARAGRPLRADDLEQAATVCRSLDGLPLALELAGAQLRNFSLSELADRLDRRFELLARTRRGTRLRQSSLLAVLEDTWELLDDNERELLRQLAAFPGSFDLAAAEAVADRIPISGGFPPLAALADRSLLSVAGGDDHRLLESVKLFARQRWHDPDGVGGYQGRHADWVIAVVRGYSTEDYHTSFELGAWIAQHYDDVRAVEAQLAAQERAEALVDVLRAHSFSIGYGSAARAAALIERIDDHLRSPILRVTQRGRLQLVAALAALSIRRPDVVGEYASRAIPLLKGTDCELDLAMAHLACALPLFGTAPERPTALLERAADLARAAGGAAVERYALSYRAFVILLASGPEIAKPELDAVERHLYGTAYDGAHSAYLQARIAERFFKDPQQAGRLCSLLLDTQARFGVLETEQWQIHRALTAANMGQVPEAAAAIEVLRAELVNNGLDPAPEILLSLAVLAWRVGDEDRARRWLAASRQSPSHLTAGPVSIRRQLRTILGNPPPATDPQPAQRASDEALGWVRALDESARHAPTSN